MEEPGSPAGLRQAPRERRSKRGRAAPRGRDSHVLGSPHTSSIYRGRGGAAPPPRFPPLGVAASPRSHLGGRPRGERGGRTTRWALGPSEPRVSPFPPSMRLGPLCGRRTSPPRGWSLPTLGPRNPLGPVAPPGGPSGPSRWSRYVTEKPELFPEPEQQLSIYKSLAPDHSGNPRDVRDLIRDSEQHSVTTYIYSL